MSIAQSTFWTSNQIITGTLGAPASPSPYFGFGTAGTGVQSTGPRIYSGPGNPNGILTAPNGSLWIDSTSNFGVIYINTTGSSVWVVLSGGGSIATTIADPGDGAAIPVTSSGILNLTVGAGAETNTLAIPSFVGQMLIINENVAGAGTRAITCAQAINVGGNTIMTFNAVRDIICLVGVLAANALRWQIAWNTNVAIS